MLVCYTYVCSIAPVQRPNGQRLDENVPFSILPFVILAIPLLEIAVFVIVGREIGVLATISLVMLTTIAGAVFVRLQGLSMLARMRRTLEEGGLPGRDLVQGFMILVAGFLLLVPGFVTDTFGLLLLLPPVRDAVWAVLKSRIFVVQSYRGPERAAERPKTIDLDERDYSSARKKRSPWRLEDKDPSE